MHLTMGASIVWQRGNLQKIYLIQKTLAAVKFADMFCKNSVDTKEFEKLKSVFKDDEISELCAFISFISASQKFGATLDLQPSCPL